MKGNNTMDPMGIMLAAMIESSMNVGTELAKMITECKAKGIDSVSVSELEEMLVNSTKKAFKNPDGMASKLLNQQKQELFQS